MNYKLDKEEQEILDAIESGEVKPLRVSKKELARYREYARNTISKRKSINIRLSERDLMLIKRKAMEKGLPYQTLIASILHQYGNR